MGQENEEYNIAKLKNIASQCLYEDSKSDRESYENIIDSLKNGGSPEILDTHQSLYNQNRGFYYFNEIIFPFFRVFAHIMKGRTNINADFQGKFYPFDKSEMENLLSHDLYETISGIDSKWNKTKLCELKASSFIAANAFSRNDEAKFVEECENMWNADRQKVHSIEDFFQRVVVFSQFSECLYDVYFDSNMTSKSITKYKETFSEMLRIGGLSWDNEEEIIELTISHERELTEEEFDAGKELFPIEYAKCLCQFMLMLSQMKVLEDEERKLLGDILQHQSFTDIINEVATEIQPAEENQDCDFSNQPILVKELKRCWKENGNLIALANFVEAKGFVEEGEKNSFIFAFSGDSKFKQEKFFTWQKDYPNLMFIVKKLENANRADWENLKKNVSVDDSKSEYQIINPETGKINPVYANPKFADVKLKEFIYRVDQNK